MSVPRHVCTRGTDLEETGAQEWACLSFFPCSWSRLRVALVLNSCQGGCRWPSARLQHFFYVLIFNLFPRDSVSTPVKGCVDACSTYTLSKVTVTESHCRRQLRCLPESLDVCVYVCVCMFMCIQKRKERRVQLTDHGVQTVTGNIVK